MLYKLEFSLDYGKTWTPTNIVPHISGKRKVESYIQERIEEKGLDWRVGFLYKLKGDVRHFRFVEQKVVKFWFPQKYMP